MSDVTRLKDQINLAIEDHMLCHCLKTELYEAWVPRWPFRASYCRNCGEVSLTTNWLLTQVWRYIVWPFWDGRVTVNKGRRWRR